VHRLQREEHGEGRPLTPRRERRTFLLMRHASPRLFVWLSLSPLLFGASLDANQAIGAPAACLAIPAGATLIDGLASGQALESGELTTLRFANLAFACGESLSSIGPDGCNREWTFSLTLPTSAMRPGTYNLSALSAQYEELFNSVGSEQGGGCEKSRCTMGVHASGPVPLTEPGATLEICSADSQCITGTIRGLKAPVFADSPDHNGTFFAIRCPS
jgi:hypothetical protein